MLPEEERHPIHYAWRERFPDAEQLLAGEGGGVYSAVGEGGYWIIQSEAGSASLLDEGENFDPIRLERYDDADDWQSARAAVLDKDLTLTVVPSIRRYVEAMPSVIEKRAAELGLPRINERDHLQPWSKQTLPRQIPHHRGCEVRSSVKVSFPDHFPRVGDVDLAIENGRARPAFLELKCGAKKDALGHCGWDLLKMAVSLQQEVCSSAFLVAATEEGWFERQALGTELFAAGEWSADDIRMQYESWFRSYERLDDPPIKRVPTSVRVEPVARAAFEIQGTRWTIAASRVAVDSDSLIDWQPFLSSGSDEVDGLAR